MKSTSAGQVQKKAAASFVKLTVRNFSCKSNWIEEIEVFMMESAKNRDEASEIIAADKTLPPETREETSELSKVDIPLLPDMRAADSDCKETARLLSPTTREDASDNNFEDETVSASTRTEDSEFTALRA